MAHRPMAIGPTIGQSIAWMVAVPTALATSVKLIASAYCEDITPSTDCENGKTPTTTKLVSRNIRGSCYVVMLLITMICAISLGQCLNVAPVAPSLNVASAASLRETIDQPLFANDRLYHPDQGDPLPLPSARTQDPNILHI